MTTTPSVAVLAGNAFVALFKREPSSATDAAWLNGYAAAMGRAVAAEPGTWIDNLGRTHTCDQFDCQTTCDTCESTDISGPPFTMERYGSFGACVIAERDWLRKAALDELVRLSEEAGLYDEPLPNHNQEKTMNDNEPPRRACIYLQSPAEAAIREAVKAVESMGGDPLLTKAVRLLAEAQDRVADYVDRVSRTE